MNQDVVSNFQEGKEVLGSFFICEKLAGRGKDKGNRVLCMFVPWTLVTAFTTLPALSLAWPFSDGQKKEREKKNNT